MSSREVCESDRGSVGSFDSRGGESVVSVEERSCFVTNTLSFNTTSYRMSQ